jgi:hypothetical protein
MVFTTGDAIEILSNPFNIHVSYFNEIPLFDRGFFKKALTKMNTVFVSW